MAAHRAYFLSNKITGHPVNRAEFGRWIPGLRYLEITGGEPMLSPENRDLLEWIVDEGRAGDVALLFNTNVTVIDPRILEALPAFADVKICLSIDDIGERLEYERDPCDWTVVLDRLEDYAALASDRCRLYAFCSVSVFNVWYLPEYLVWLEEIRPRVPMEFKLNLVHGPRSFCVQALPDPVKHSVATRLREEILDRSVDPGIRSEVEGLVRFLEVPVADAGTAWTEGWAEIRKRDRIRSQRFEEVFPAFHEELTRLGALPAVRAPDGHSAASHDATLGPRPPDP